MVKLTLYTLMLSVFSLQWLFHRLGIGIRQITWLPEICSILMFGYVYLAFVTNRNAYIHKKYLIILSIYVLHIFIGIIVNQVPSGAAFSAFRVYFKYLPFFFLPAVYNFTEKEISFFLKFLLVLALLQCPVALLQRLVIFKGTGTGDVVGGTLGLNTSSGLTIILLLTAAFLIAHFLRNKIKFKWFITVLIVLLIPTGLNETKSVITLMPQLIIVPFLFSRKDRFQLKKVLPLLLIMGIIFTGWKVTYDHFQSRDIATYATEEGQFEKYSSARTKPLEIAIKYVSEDLMHAAFGLGAGNFSGSFSDSMRGRLDEFEKFQPQSTQITLFIWAIGFGGLLIFFTFLGMIFFDAKKYSSKDDLIGIISLATMTTTIIFVASIFYKSIMTMNYIIYPFFFMAGFVASGKKYRTVPKDDNAKIVV